MPAIDRGSPLPLWAQVLDDLRRRLDAGEFAQRFPTDRELVEEYGLSRHTVRDAVRRLHLEGRLDRHRGRGTFVRAPEIEQPVGALYSLFRSVEGSGAEQRSVVRRLERTVDEAAASQLDLPAEAELVVLERVRLADGEPLALDRSWLPADLTAALLEVDFAHTALYTELAQRCGIFLDRGWERLRPGLPTQDERATLGIGGRDAVFRIERRAEARGRPVEWRTAVVRGDRFVFVTRWSATGAEPTLGAEPATPPPRRPDRARLNALPEAPARPPADPLRPHSRGGS
jgi:GntR family transcriptional regulator